MGDPPVDGVIIRGFAFTGTATNPAWGAIALFDGGAHHIACNHIGFDATGASASPDHYGYGVVLDSAHDVVIGTNGDGVDDVGEGNLFGSADEFALWVYGSDANWIAGNTFGGAVDGAWSLLRVVDASSNLVGSDENGVSDELERNYFTTAGFVIIDGGPGSDSINNRVVGNTFGFTPTGELDDGASGVELSLPAGSTGTEIRSNIFGKTTYGVEIQADAPVLIADNTFGTAATAPPYSYERIVAVQGGGDFTIRGNTFRNADGSAIRVHVNAMGGTRDAYNNCFVGNRDVVSFSDHVAEVTFENNWYGVSDGPSGLGPGSGDPISFDIDFTPWLDSPLAQCNEAPVVSDAESSVPEDAASGTVVATVATTDDGAAALSYSITEGNPDGAFAIDSATGEISVAGGLDYETISAYDLTISVADPFANGSATVTVGVTDVFELTNTPTFTDDDGSILEADIERRAEAGVTRGCNPPDNDLFCPDQPVTRGQMAAFLYRALGG